MEKLNIGDLVSFKNENSLLGVVTNVIKNDNGDLVTVFQNRGIFKFDNYNSDVLTKYCNDDSLKIVIKEQEYVFVARSERENVKFIENLRKAESYLNKAMSEVKYAAFPDINKGAVDGLTGLINDVSRMAGCVINGCYIVLKPEINNSAKPDQNNNEYDEEQLYFIRDFKGNIWNTGLTYDEALIWIDNHEGINYIMIPQIDN